jgi:hypothetical protein
MIIDFDMLTDPGGIFLGEGLSQLPWVPSKIDGHTVRGVSGTPHTARRYWLTNTFTEANGDFEYIIKYIPTPPGIETENTATLMAGFYDKNEPLNYLNFIGNSVYYSIVESAHWAIYSTYADKLGNVFAGTPALIPIAGTTRIRLECTYKNRILTTKVYDDVTGILAGTSTLNIPLWFGSIDLNSFGFGNWDEPIGLSFAKFEIEIGSTTGRTTSASTGVPFYFGRKP